MLVLSAAYDALAKALSYISVWAYCTIQCLYNYYCYLPRSDQITQIILTLQFYFDIRRENEEGKQKQAMQNK